MFKSEAIDAVIFLSFKKWEVECSHVNLLPEATALVGLIDGLAPQKKH